MKNPWLHRCAILLSVLAVIVIALGALLTSEIRTLPGAATPSNVTAPSLEQAHRIAGYVLAALAFLLISPRRTSRVKLGDMLPMIVLIETVARGPVVHALLAPLIFALVAAMAVLTSKSWQDGPTLVKSPWEPLRTLGMAIPVLVVMQIGLGTAFRHNAMGVIWHILDALIVLLAILVAGVFVIRQFPEHLSLRPAALTLLIVTGVQVLLGFAVYLILLMSSDNNSALIVIGVMHVTNGALTLAASVVLAMQMHRNLEVTNRSVTAS